MAQITEVSGASVAGRAGVAVGMVLVRVNGDPAIPDAAAGVTEAACVESMDRGLGPQVLEVTLTFRLVRGRSPRPLW